MNHIAFGQTAVPTPISCQAGYLNQQQVIGRQTEEIDQLQALLLDVLNRYNYRSLRHSAIAYYQSLNALRTRLNRLHRNLICEGLNCSKTLPTSACQDARFGLSAALEHHVTVLTDEFERIKANCTQLLSGMLALNLL